MWTSPAGAPSTGCWAWWPAPARGEFNHRGAQPSVQPTPSFGHRFPFADAAQDDPRTGRRDGLLERVAAESEPPKVVFVDTAAEYWRGASTCSESPRAAASG